MVHTSTYLTCLVGISGKDFVAVARIDQDAGEIPKRKIATSTAPACATIVRHIESLFGSDVYVLRFLRILGNGVYRRLARKPFNLVPTLTAISGNKHTGGGRAYPNRFRLLQVC